MCIRDRPPPAQRGTVAEIQRSALHDAVLAGGLELHLSLIHIYYDLDELQWDSSGAYGQKRAPEERRRLLDDILEKPDWVIEGVYHLSLIHIFFRPKVKRVLDAVGNLR